MQPFRDFLIGRGQHAPHRFVLRDGDAWHRMIDLQTVIETGGGFSVYLRPALGYLYVTTQPRDKFSVSHTEQTTIVVTHDTSVGTTYYNPYLSWHGSGVVHANAFETEALDKIALIRNSRSVRLADIGGRPTPILSAHLPLAGASYPLTAPPPSDFDGNYFEVSDRPYRPNTFGAGNPTIHVVLDREALRPGIVVVDIMCHDPETDFGPTNQPYGRIEAYAVAPPLKITPDSPELPAVTIFMYQPIGDTSESGGSRPITLWGVSNGQEHDFAIQVSPA